MLPEAVSLAGACMLVVASFFTAALTAAAGVGGGLLMLGLMTYVIPPMALIPVHGFVQLGSNSGRAFIQRAHIHWPVTNIFLVGAIIGALCGVFLVVQLPERVLQVFLGIFIVLVVWIKLPRIENPNTLIIALGGIVTTFISMFAGATGPLVAVFFDKLFDKHKTLVATHGTAMTAQHGVKVIAFMVAGFALSQWIWLIAAMVLCGFLGSKFGSVLLDHLPEKYLKLAFRASLTLVALDLLRRGLTS